MSEAQERYKQGGLFVAVVACPNNMSASLIHDLKGIYEDPNLRVSGLLSGLNLESDERGFHLVRDNANDISVEFEEVKGKRRTKTLERWVRDHINGKRHSLGFGYDRIGLDLLFYETDDADSRIIDSWLLENFIPGEVSALETRRNPEEAGHGMYHFCRGWIARNEAVEKLAYVEFCKRKGINEKEAEGRFSALSDNSLAPLHIREMFLEEEHPEQFGIYRSWMQSIEDIDDDAKHAWLTEQKVPARVSEIMAHTLAKEVMQERNSTQAELQFADPSQAEPATIPARGHTAPIVIMDESPFVPPLIQADLGDKPTNQALFTILDELASARSVEVLRSLEAQYMDVFDGDATQYHLFIDDKLMLFVRNGREFADTGDFVLAYARPIHGDEGGFHFWGIDQNHVVRRIEWLATRLEFSQEAVEQMVEQAAAEPVFVSGAPVFEFAPAVVANHVPRSSDGVDYEEKIIKLIGQNFDLKFVGDDELGGRQWVIKPFVNDGRAQQGVVILGVPEHVRASTFDQVANMKAAFVYLSTVMSSEA